MHCEFEECLGDHPHAAISALVESLLRLEQLDEISMSPPCRERSPWHWSSSAFVSTSRPLTLFERRPYLSPSPTAPEKIPLHSNEWTALGSPDLRRPVQDDRPGGNAVHPFHGQPFQPTSQRPGCLRTHPNQGRLWHATFRYPRRRSCKCEN